MAQLAITIAVMAVQIGLSYLFQKKPKTPSQPELLPTSSIYGTPVKTTWGSMKQGGTVIWQSRRRKKKKNIGKGGGGGVLISYHQDVLVAFGADGRDILAITADQKQEPLYDARSAKVKKKYKETTIRIYKGGPEQLPDPLVEADRGVGNCSANRRLTTVMLENLRLDDFGGRIPNLVALVVEEPTSTNRTDPLINDIALQPGGLFIDRRPDKAFVYATGGATIFKIDATTCALVDQLSMAYPYGSFGPGDSDSDGYLYYNVNAPGTLTDARVGIGKFSADTLMPVGIGMQGEATVLLGNGYYRVDQYSDDKLLMHVDSGTIRDANSTMALFYRENMQLIFLYPSSELAATVGVPWGSHNLHDVDFDDQGAAWCIYSSNDETVLLKVGKDRSVEVKGRYDGVPGAISICWVPDDNTVLIRSIGTLAKIELDTFTIVTSRSLFLSDNGNSMHCGIWDSAIWFATTMQDADVAVPPGGQSYFPQFIRIDVRTLATVDTQSFQDVGSQYPLPGYAYFAPRVAIYTPNAQAIIADAFPGGTVGCFHILKEPDCIPLQDVVEDLSRETGRLQVPAQVNATALASDAVCGYVREQRQPTRTDIETLGQVYGFYGVDSDWVIKYAHFGGEPTLEIPEDDMAAYENGGQRPELTLDEEFVPDFERPKRVDLTYYDEAMDYQQNAQHWDLPQRNVQSTDKQTFTLPVVLDRDDAKNIARRLLYQIRDEANPYKFTLPPKYLALDPGDDVRLAMNNGARIPVKLTKIELGTNFLLQCEAVSIHPGIYVPVTGKGGPGGAPIPIEIGDRPGTVAIIMDSPTFRDADNGVAGPFVAVAPSNGIERNWGGGVLMKSVDGSTWSDVDIFTTPAILGYTLTVLPAPPRGAWTIWDRTSTVRIKLVYEGDGLENLTDDQVLAFGNAAKLGDETIQFTTATPIGPAADQVWELSGLLRGRRGTGWAISSHRVGEPFVLLDSLTVDRLNDSLSEMNFQRIYRAVTSGLSLEESTAIPFTNTGRALKPYAPTFIRGARDGSNNLTVTALPVSRFSNTFNPWNNPPPGEAIQSYDMDVLVGGVMKRSITQQPSLAFTYAAADQTADGITPGAPVDVVLYQRSATIGRGFPAEATV